MMRIGMGFDVHDFTDGRPLILGGVAIPHGRGLMGHSDADVLTHALMDAILGAMRAGDIGEHFPDTDPAYKGADSMHLLGEVMKMMRAGGWELVDADCVIALESPKVAPYRDAMRSNIAGWLGVDVSSVGLKATTTEGLGFVGRGEGAAAWAVVLLERTALDERLID
jgi:2-C-methyl-D-erythritol 2,4-cyclodiphosphate synthase